jgi:hypothetical protein
MKTVLKILASLLVTSSREWSFSASCHVKNILKYWREEQLNGINRLYTHTHTHTHTHTDIYNISDGIKINGL